MCVHVGQGAFPKGPPLTVNFRSSNGRQVALFHSVCLAEGSEESSDQPIKPKVTGRTCQLERSTSFVFMDPTLCGRPGNLQGIWFSSRPGEELENRREEGKRQ